MPYSAVAYRPQRQRWARPSRRLLSSEVSPLGWRSCGQRFYRWAGRKLMKISRAGHAYDPTRGTGPPGSFGVEMLARLRLLWIVTCALVTTMGGLAAPAGAASGWIALSRWDGSAVGTSEVWLIRPDGSGLMLVHQFTDNVFTDMGLLSPDGRTILLRRDSNDSSKAGAEPRIWTLGVVSGAVAEPDASYQPSFYSGDLPSGWSPDGRYILFSRSGPSFHSEIFRMEASGANVVALTAPVEGVNSLSAVYSPDGSKIAYAAGTYFDRQAWIMNADGSGQQQLTHDAGDVSWVSWAPDGSKLVYGVQAANAPEFTVHTIKPDGGEEQTLTGEGEDNAVPFYSTDGTQIAFSHFAPEANAFELSIMNADGGQPAPVPNAPARAIGFSWTSAEPIVPPARITVSVSPSSPSASAPFTVTAVARDASGTRIKSYDAPASWSDLTGKLSPYEAPHFVNGIAKTTQASVASPSHADALTVSSFGAKGTSKLFNVTGPLDHIALSVPRKVKDGAGFTVKAYARDVLNDTITSYTGAATWSDLTGTLSPVAPSTFVKGVSKTTGAIVATPTGKDSITLSSGGITGTSGAFVVE